MDEKSIIEEIIFYSKLAFDRRLVPGVSGNTSIFYDGKLYITGTNTCLGNLKPADIDICDLEGNVLRGNLKPSKETGMHALMYKLRPEARCILHLHPTNIIALSLVGKTIPAITATFDAKLKKVPLLPFEPTGSAALMSNIKNMLGSVGPEVSIFTIAKHGTVAFSDTMLGAFAVSDLAEDSAKIAILYGALKDTAL